MTDEIEPSAPSYPAGEYAIVEVLGHRTLVGRVAEVERFGTKLLAIEPIFKDALLPAALVGGSSIYQFTSCSAEIAFARQPRERYQLPTSISATLPEEERQALPRPDDVTCQECGELVALCECGPF